MKKLNVFKKILIRVGFLIVASVSLIAFQNFTFTGNEVGVDNSVNVAKGQVLGSCLYQVNAAFQPVSEVAAKDIAWPMLSCNAQGVATCADGFQMIDETPVQMNCDANPSANLTNCYWGAKKCVSTTGSIKATDFIRGQSYGGCLTQRNESFAVTAVTYVAWPMLTCDMSGNTSCEPGFKAVKETPVQMNCSTTPSKSNTLNCFFLTTRCVKL